MPSRSSQRTLYLRFSLFCCFAAEIFYDMMLYLFTAIGLTPSGSSTVNIYTQTIHRTTRSTQTIHRTTQLTNWEECGPCPVFVSYSGIRLTTEEKARKNLSQSTDVSDNLSASHSRFKQPKFFLDC